ncbi:MULTISPECIES: ferrochelatase [Acidiphilium]|uniref:Ferrochelatase n=1 Tax=Acidiphilium rubrum TaxID=526 RepID=A0A8G2CKT3_ACIRU|nr:MULTISPECIES: ferrochelatase [Acidiphilium]OYW02294.1 MAG: ferrochelatase [Acidiphilium sp. 37-64-53]OZB29230.1 MAG: ferrochelatase [Acidiphilium sp. 34-64-41]SIQ84501.1 ferrochelatase [Acidiphilium rubrum]HQT85446.1 ferrochelatase [Acidiphilium rubrum]
MNDTEPVLPARTAIVLFNLGGPDGADSIKPFRVNLFSDPAIIRAPIFIRFWLARLIAASAQSKAEEGYAMMGGKSPLLELTQRQADALEASLPGSKCFIAMRYWHPFAGEVAQAVKAWAPERILLLPLYPQFSTTTTGSSLADWHDAAAKTGLVVPTTTLCCWYDDPAFAAAIAGLVMRTLATARAELPAGTPIRLLFSAHGLPESIIKAGDPYQEEVEACTEAVMDVITRALGERVDYQVCFQSRATPQQWIEPSTEQAIEKAAHDGTAVVVIPIAFVSEHIETLVELDVEYREVAEKLHLPGYYRAPAPNDDPAFIAALAGIARRAIVHGDGLCSHRGGRSCTVRNSDCPWARYRALVPA